jgi:hypothetical protein
VCLWLGWLGSILVAVSPNDPYHGLFLAADLGHEVRDVLLPPPVIGRDGRDLADGDGMDPRSDVRRLPHQRITPAGVVVG